MLVRDKTGSKMGKAGGVVRLQCKSDPSEEEGIGLTGSVLDGCERPVTPRNRSAKHPCCVVIGCEQPVGGVGGFQCSYRGPCHVCSL